MLKEIISLPCPKKTQEQEEKTHWTMKFLNPHPMRRINVALSPHQSQELPSRRSYCASYTRKGTSLSDLFFRSERRPWHAGAGISHTVFITEVWNKGTTILLQSHSRNKMVA